MAVSSSEFRNAASTVSKTAAVDRGNEVQNHLESYSHVLATLRIAHKRQGDRFCCSKLEYECVAWLSL